LRIHDLSSLSESVVDQFKGVGGVALACVVVYGHYKLGRQRKILNITLKFIKNPAPTNQNVHFYLLC